jgi:hypothetical protein
MSSIIKVTVAGGASLAWGAEQSVCRPSPSLPIFMAWLG